jgi:hypothetical protein
MTDYKQLCADLHAAFNTYAVCEEHHELLQRTRNALAQPEPEGPTPQPVPVSERLPGANDCNAEGRCWWYGEGGDMVGWTLDAEGLSYYRAKYWLPAHALPVPTND